jgi:hypothetical protein
MPLRIARLVKLAALTISLMLPACSTLRALEPVLAPPSQFQLDRAVAVEFVAERVIAERCAERGAFNSGACGSRDLITLPDPCAVRGDGYAQGLCGSVGMGGRQVTIAFVHPDLAPGHCPVAGEGNAAQGVVVCVMPDRVVAVNPCLYPDKGRYVELACHELGHVNGWGAGHPGGSFVAQPSFVKARLEPEDVLSPEAVRVALLAKGDKRP